MRRCIVRSISPSLPGFRALYDPRPSAGTHSPYGYFQSVPAYRVNGDVSRSDQFESKSPAGFTIWSLRFTRMKRSRVKRMEEPNALSIQRFDQWHVASPMVITSAIIRLICRFVNAIHPGHSCRWLQVS